MAASPLRSRFVALAACAALGGCATVRGWIGLGGDEPPPPPPPPTAKTAQASGKVETKGPSDVAPTNGAAPAPSDSAPDDVSATADADAAVRAARQAELKTAIRGIEQDLKSGKIGFRDAEKRLKPLKKDLAALAEDVARSAKASAGGTARDGTARDAAARDAAARDAAARDAAARDGTVEARLSALERRFDELERKLDEIARRLDDR